MSNKKIKLLVLSDHYLSPSGVGTQTKYIVDGLLKTGKYQVGDKIKLSIVRNGANLTKEVILGSARS